MRYLRGIAPHLAWTAAADVGAAHAGVPTGSVSAVAASLSVAVAMQAQFDRLELYTGPGAAVGLASLAGEPDAPQMRGHHFTALYIAPLWFNRLAYRASARLRLALELEVGVTARPVHATGAGAANAAGAGPDDLFELDGVSLSAGASLGWTL